ncbi:MAG: sugar O-acetyltransferase [Gemmiger sp.]|uniref:sugar O-acetyltransferase n=1 Tax=Gemmiger sp. TaxID=2049027 RepID=UPI002E764B9D|nr:sugar O-acetyltransferase [Gemmiger sp.]MEE0800574.1 sugar O-acetyltransferase [Gemmiger sp.]
MEKSELLARMADGRLYDSSDPRLQGDQAERLDRVFRYNQLPPSCQAEKAALLRELFAEIGDGCYIETPFHANWGGKNVHFGSGVYANFNLTLVDDGEIRVGSHVMIGPNVVLTTAGHPVEPSLRRRAVQYNLPISIGDNVWLGAGCLVMPGVTIGENSVIGAGSVVTRDIPANVVAVGVPCRVLRPIGPRDRQFYHRDLPVDFE